MTAPHLQHLGMHANHLSRHTNDGKMQAILQWVGVGSVILMGAGAAVHLYRDLIRPQHEWKPEPCCHRKQRELLGEVNRHAERDGRGR